MALKATIFKADLQIADILITKDKALLKLARKTAKAGMFKIMLPEGWTLPG